MSEDLRANVKLSVRRESLQKVKRDKRGYRQRPSDNNDFWFNPKMNFLK